MNEDANEAADPTPTVPEGYSKTIDLKFINGKLHQKHVSPHGTGAEHWQPVESEGNQRSSDTPAA
jgi:hypothetical protein